MKDASRVREVFTVFILALIARCGFSFLLFEPEQQLKWLPKNFDKIATILARNEQHQYPSAWASYPVYLSRLYKALEFFGLYDYRLVFVVALNCLAGAICVTLFYLICRKVYPDQIIHNRIWFSRFLTFAFCLYYPLAYFGVLILSENLFMPCLLGLFLLFMSDDRLSYKRGVLLGLLAAVCYSIRPIVLSFFPLVILYFLYHYKQEKKYNLFKIAISILLGFLPLIYWVADINAKSHTGSRATLAGNGGVNIAIAWCKPREIKYQLPNAESWWFSSPEYWDRERISEILTDVPFSNQWHYIQMAIDCLKQHPEYLLGNLKHIPNSISGRFYPSFRSDPMHRVLIGIWKIAGVFLLFGMFFYSKSEFGERRGYTLGVLLLFSLMFSVYLANPGEERYFTVYFFVPLIWGSAGIVSVLKKNEQRLNQKTVFATIFTIVVLCGGWLGWRSSITTPTNFKNFVRKSASELSASQLRTAYRMATDWLVRNQKYDGSFNYLMSSVTGLVDKRDLTTRQLLSAHGLALAARDFDDLEIQVAHERSLKYLDTLITKQENYAYVRGKTKWQPLNETSFAIFTLIDSPQQSKYLEKLELLGNFILQLQKTSGEFYLQVPKDEKDNSKFFDHRFASGEAALACSRLYRVLQDTRFLKCAESAFEYYYPRIQVSGFHPSFISWHTLAYVDMFEQTKELKYLDAVENMSIKLLRLQNKKDSQKKIPGGFDVKYNWNTSAEAVYTEALGQAAGVLASEQRPVAQKLAEGHALGFYNLIYFQLRNYQNPQLRGAIQSESNLQNIYVDNVGHALVAFHHKLISKELLH